MKTRQLNGPIFILGALVVATSLYIYYGLQTQKTLEDLNILLQLTLATCLFTTVFSIRLCFKQSQQCHTESCEHFEFMRMQGLTILPPTIRELYKEKIKQIILHPPNQALIDPRVDTSVNDVAERFKESLVAKL